MHLRSPGTEIMPPTHPSAGTGESLKNPEGPKIGTDNCPRIPQISPKKSPKFPPKNPPNFPQKFQKRAKKLTLAGFKSPQKVLKKSPKKS
jgi:hypothetical protein